MNFAPDINVFEEVNSATPPQPPHIGPVFPNFPAQDVVDNAIDRSTRRTPIYVDTAEIRTEGPIFRDETEAENDLGGRFEAAAAAAGGFEAGPEFEALKEGMADIGREDRGGHAVFGHTTPLYHPYAEPLSHYNPLG